MKISDLLMTRDHGFYDHTFFKGEGEATFILIFLTRSISVNLSIQHFFQVQYLIMIACLFNIMIKSL